MRKRHDNAFGAIPWIVLVGAWLLAACSESPSGPAALQVGINPQLSPEGAFRVGKNPGRPEHDYPTNVVADRLPDGSLYVVVQDTSVSKVWLRDTAGGSEATAMWAERSYPTGKPLRGRLVSSLARTQEIVNAPLVIDVSLVKYINGSDISNRWRVMITAADLR